MKTDPMIIRALELRLSLLPGEADVTLPVQIVRDLLADIHASKPVDDTTDPGPTAVLHIDTDEEHLLEGLPVRPERAS